MSMIKEEPVSYFKPHQQKYEKTFIHYKLH
jgi:hypothetical protein